MKKRKEENKPDNVSLPHTHVSDNTILISNSKRIVNNNTNKTIRVNTNDITEDVLRVLTKSSLIIRFWNALPESKEEPIWYEELEHKLNTSKSALHPLIQNLEDLGLVKRIIRPVKDLPICKLNRHYFRKNGRLILNHS